MFSKSLSACFLRRTVRLHFKRCCRNLMEIHISPKQPLIDDKLQIIVKGLEPNQKVTIRASVTESKSSFSASACYTSDDQGNVRVHKQPSVGGTYTGVDSMGLFWSMTQDPGQKPGQRYMKRIVATPQTVQLSVIDGHLPWEECHNPSVKPILSSEIDRWFFRDDVKREEIREGNLRGTLFTPKGPGPYPGVIDLFGSAGGLIEFRAAMLASRGFVTYALPYFAYDDLPKNMGGISFEFLKETVEWFSNQPKVIPNGIGIVGVSKGGEIALMLATQCSQVKSVVNINGTPFCSYLPIPPFNDFVEADLSKYKFEEEGAIIMDALNVNLQTKHILQTWKSDAKVLYLVGEDDVSVDPKYANILEDCYPRDQRHKLTVIRYPKAGHLLEPCYLPFCRASFHKLFGMVFVWGGSMKEHAKAQEDSWSKIQNFLRSTLTEAKQIQKPSSHL